MTGTLLIHSLNVATEGSLTLYTCPMWQWMNCLRFFATGERGKAVSSPAFLKPPFDICSVLQMLRLCLVFPFPRTHLSRHLSK